MSTMCTISDVQEYQSDILEYGIQDFDNYFTKATNDILRMLQIDWWMVERSKGRGRNWGARARSIRRRGKRARRGRR